MELVQQIKSRRQVKKYIVKDCSTSDCCGWKWITKCEQFMQPSFSSYLQKLQTNFVKVMTTFEVCNEARNTVIRIRTFANTCFCFWKSFCIIPVRFWIEINKPLQTMWTGQIPSWEDITMSTLKCYKWLLHFQQFLAGHQRWKYCCPVTAFWPFKVQNRNLNPIYWQ